jgi:Cu/Zn superoxide dismutase
MSRAVGAWGLTVVLLLWAAAPAHADRRFQATLVSTQEVPATASSARGLGTVVLNATETQITVNLSFSGLSTSPIAAHVHGSAAVGSNAGILFDFSAALPAATSGSIATQTFAISGAQVAELKAGRFYFNIHTATYGGGEIRGQILTAPAQIFAATLLGSEQVPPTTSSATGTGKVFLNAAENQIIISLTFSGLTSDATGAHIHGPASPGANAGILFDFSGAVPPTTSNTIVPQTFSITPDQVAQLKAGQFYFNIHTATFGNGEIRGQILTPPTQKFGSTLDGYQVVPLVTSPATSTGTVLLSAAEDRITVTLGYSRLTSAPTAAHIHGPAGAGTNAGVLFDLSSRLPPDNRETTIEQIFTITPAQVVQLKEGQLYLDVHSSNYANGEIRGQVLQVPSRKFEAALTGFQVSPPTFSPGTGKALILMNPTEDQITVDAEFGGLLNVATAARLEHFPFGFLLFPLDGLEMATHGVVAEQSFALTPQQAALLKSREFRIAIPTISFPGGEIGGVFHPNPTLTIQKGGHVNGTIVSSPAGIVCGGDCAETFERFDATGAPLVVTLTAQPSPPGIAFRGWSGGRGQCTGTDPCVVTFGAGVGANDDQILIATFAPTSFLFTDETLIAGATTVKAAHISELRAAVNTLRIRYGLPTFAFADPTLAPSATPIQALHIGELRTALNAVYVHLWPFFSPPPSYTDPAIAAGTGIKRIHIVELRNAVRALE